MKNYDLWAILSYYGTCWFDWLDTAAVMSIIMSVPFELISFKLKFMTFFSQVYHCQLPSFPPKRQFQQIQPFYWKLLQLKNVTMVRLNSGIFGTFELSECNINLNSSGCRALKIIKNDTKLEPISWGPRSENPIFNFCVGVWVGGNPREVFLHG